jgi:hypothetical protein
VVQGAGYERGLDGAVPYMMLVRVWAYSMSVKGMGVSIRVIWGIFSGGLVWASSLQEVAERASDEW